MVVGASGAGGQSFGHWKVGVPQGHRVPVPVAWGWQQGLGLSQS